VQYRERFNISFDSRYIQFTEPLRNVRNKIVHNGGEANERLSFEQIDFLAGDNGHFDQSFSKKYRKFAVGTGALAEVSISEDQLRTAIDKAVRLVKYAATQLYVLELAAEKRQKEEQKGSSPSFPVDPAKFRWPLRKNAAKPG
jgi:hypothetical protein